jgi:hypothetical protein
MDESYPKTVLGGGTIEHVLHEASANGTVLHGGIDCNGAKARNGGPFVEEVTTDDAPIQFRDNGIKPGMR